MSFLSGETIRARLDVLIIDEQGNPAGNEEQIDCNSYSLKLDEDYFSTRMPSFINVPFISTLLHKINFGKRENKIFIESGQFALLLTREFVNIPNDLMGFISMKSQFKLQGLVNVSGFHVDPGWKGKLTFTVYNAGPHRIPLKIDDLTFLIWFSKLDIEETGSLYRKNIDVQKMKKEISVRDVYQIDGETYSPHMLGSHIDSIKKRWYLSILFLIVTFLIGLIFGIGSDVFSFYTRDQVGYKQTIKEEVYQELKDEIETNSDLKGEIEKNRELIEKLIKDGGKPKS